MLASLFGHIQVSSRFILSWTIAFDTESSEPASGIAQDVLYARRCELGYPTHCQYSSEDVSTACRPLPVILSAWETYEDVSILDFLWFRHSKSYMDAISAIDAVVIIVKTHVAM